MKNLINQWILPLLFLFLLIFLLISTGQYSSLAREGLSIWYQNMIPSLFPFMVISGFMVNSNISLKIGQLLQPILGFFFRISSQMLYVIFMGFFCGFPMGAKITADLLHTKKITIQEGQYLLAFCNNIGPMYLTGFVFPLFQIEAKGKFLILMYAIPLMYGLILRYTVYANIPSELPHTFHPPRSPKYLHCFQLSLSNAVEQIAMLGGCMVFFNCLRILPKKFFLFLSDKISAASLDISEGILSSFIEIGGGLTQLQGSFLNSFMSAKNYLLLALLSFGGLSCIMQTFFIIKNTGLNISTYIKHKILQSCIFIIIFFISVLL